MLAAAGVSVTVFVPDDSIPDYSITEAGKNIRVLLFNSDRSGKSAFLGYSARLSYEFATIVQLLISLDGRPDIIEAQDYLGIAYYLLQFKHLLYNELKNIPIFLTLHSPAFLYLEYNRVPTYRFPDFQTCEMEKQAIKMADHLISPTHYLIDAISPDIDVDRGIISVIRNPFKSIPDTLFPVQRHKIMYYGKLSPQKGSFELLRYFKEMWDQGFRHPLHIVGGTDIVYHPERLTMGQMVNRDYKKYIRRGNLILHGKIRPSDLEGELKAAHVIIVPSIVDNLPYVVIEAMSLGKIVLASIQGGQQEMIDKGINGFLFDHTKPGDFEQQLSFILSLSDDRIAAIGMAAREKVKEMYAPAVIAPQKIRLMSEIIRSRQKESITGGPFQFPFLHQEPFRPLLQEHEDLIGQQLSVVIPYYNMGEYIEECIWSVKASSYPVAEIILVDDGSNDHGSIAILERLALISSVKIYRKANEGLAETRNFGARKASGQFLAFLDADDVVAPDYYEKAIRVLQHYDNVFFAGSWVQYFGKTSHQWITYMPQPPYLLVHNPLNSSGLVYKKQAFLQAGLNDKKVDYGLEDYDSVISMMAAGYNGVALPELLFHYRVRKNSMFRKVTGEKLLYSYKYITEKHAAYYAKFAPGVINLLNANGPGYIFDNPTFGVTIQTRQESHSWWIRKIKAIVQKNRFLKKIALKIIK